MGLRQGVRRASPGSAVRWASARHLQPRIERSQWLAAPFPAAFAAARQGALESKRESLSARLIERILAGQCWNSSADGLDFLGNPWTLSVDFWNSLATFWISLENPWILSRPIRVLSSAYGHPRYRKHRRRRNIDHRFQDFALAFGAVRQRSKGGWRRSRPRRTEKAFRVPFGACVNSSQWQRSGPRATNCS